MLTLVTWSWVGRLTALSLSDLLRVSFFMVGYQKFGLAALGL